MNFVYGLANVKLMVGVFSFFWFDPSFTGEEVGEAIVSKRCVVVMIHEIGHMFGLLHCTYFKCIMNGTNS